jgi:hypothetical protein
MFRTGVGIHDSFGFFFYDMDLFIVVSDFYISKYNNHLMKHFFSSLIKLSMKFGSFRIDPGSGCEKIYLYNKLYL